MLKRNGSKGTARVSKQRYTQRLNDIANADNEFIQNVEENTNFMMPTRRGGKSKSRDKTSHKHAPTILSQVKKYGGAGSQKHGHRYVRTDEGVTDEQKNYLSRRTEYTHDHMNPPTKSEQNLAHLPKLRKSLKNLQQRNGMQNSPTNLKAKDLDSVKQSINVASTSKLPARSNLDLKLKEQRHPSVDSEIDKPISEKRLRVSRPFTVASQNNSRLVAKQIKENAGSRGFLLNEDSEEIEPGLDVEARIGMDSDEVHVKGNSEQEMLMVESTDKQTTTQLQSFQNTHMGSQSHFKTQPRPQMAQTQVALNSANDQQRIANLVNSENKRLWKLYDNTLVEKSGISKRERELVYGKEQSRFDKKASGKQSGLNKSDSLKRVGQFIEAVKNHTIYRRDNFVRNFANQTKQSFDPYLKFQIEAKKDPFKTRPLSSAVSRANAMYPSRDTVRRANQTDGIPQAATSFNTNRNRLRPGQPRPLSSNFNNILLIRKDASGLPQGKQGMSFDRLANAKLVEINQLNDSAVLSGQVGSKRTTRAGTNTQQNFLSSFGCNQSETTVNQPQALQHQRMLSYQLNNLHRGNQHAANKYRSRQRPVSSVPHAGKLHYLTSNAERQTQVGEHNQALSNEQTGDQFGDTHQIFDPSLMNLSQPLTGTGRHQTYKQMSDVDMQMGVLSDEQAAPGDLNQTAQFNPKLSQPQSRPLTSPFTQTQLNTQPTRASNEFKSSQNLIQQLRIKSVRQSKVRIIQDPSVQGQYDIVTGGREQEDEIQFANSPQSKSKQMLFPKDRVVSNATNLHRATDSQETGPLMLQSNLSSEQTTNFGDSSQRKAANSFPEMHCKQLSIDALMNYEIIEHMQEFLVYSQTQCPIFIFDPSDCAPTRATLIFSRFKECIEIGELEQASSMINLGMKQKQFLPAFKMNVGVTFILSGRYMEAIQTFRMLAQSYPQSPSIHSNLLFAYLCDGWVENVKEFQSHTLFNQIQSPLSLQTQSILELIKYAFTNPDLIKFSKKSRSKSVPKFSSTRVLSAKELNFVRALNNDFQDASDLMEADEVEEENSESDFQQDPQAVVNLDYFKKNRRIKDFTRREKLDPMNHLLRKKMREARHPELVRPKTAELRPKTLSPNRQDAFSGLPNYWEHYQDMLTEYHRKDSNRQAQEKAYFEKVLDRIHRLCKDEENFQTGIKTKIEKSLPLRAKNVSTLKTFSKKRSTIGSIQSSLGPQSAEEKVRQEGDVNRILQKVKKVEEEKVKQIAEQGQMLDQIFQQLVSQRTTYVSSTASDPIDSSYLELIDGLGKFHERYNVRAFVDNYIQLQRDIDQSELNLELEEQKGKKWAAENMSPEQLFDKKELTQRFIDSYPVFEESVDRAKTFLLDVLFNKQESEIVPFKQMFEEMAYFAEDRKLKMTMDTERFNVESSFIKIMRELISVQQDLAQRIINTKNLAQVQQLKEKSELNDAYIKLLNEQKELCGRNAETVLLKNLEISKGKHAERADLALKIEAPFVNKDDETINPVAPEKQEYYRELYTRGWEKFTYRELPAEEKLLVQQKISEEADQALAKARVKTQQRIIDNIKAKRKIGDEKTLEKIVQLEQKLEELKKHVKTVKSEEQTRLTAFELAKQLEMNENLAIAQHDMQEYQIGLINAKLNLDAIEIKNRLPQNNTEDINLWEETAALKVVKKKIEQITDTINNPQLLFEKDKEKHRPMLEKWNNATRDIINRAKTGKSIKHLSNTLSDSLKDTIQQDEKQRHWQVRPKIGHELTNTQIGLIDTNIKQWSQISTDEIMAMDSLLAKNCRFFSIFDKSTRLAMYEHCQVNRYEGEEREIERDVEETEQIQVLLRGNIHIVQVNDDLDIRLRLASLRAGEVFGDQSIQRKIQDPLKILSKERKTAVTNSSETITISIQKEHFMGALFQEMQQELFYKIILLQNTNFFEELSPYSLTIIASNVEVREVKYGEVLVQQGQVPDAMYILAYGQCKTMYQYVEQKSTRVSKYANKCLKSDLPKPVHTGMVNYQSLGYQNRRTDSNDPQPDKVDANQKKSGSEAKTKAGQPNNEAYRPKMSEQVQKRLESMDCAPAKRAFYHTILGENKKTMTIRFQNHLVYQKLKAGQFFGMRSLLDPLICKKHVLELRQMFCKKLDIDLDSLWKELVKQQQLSLDQVSLLKVKRKEANKQATKFCNKCFEQEIEHCTCLLNKLDPKQKQLAEEERYIKLQQEKKGIESSFYEEFNDSHDYDISMQQSFESKQSQKQTRTKNDRVKNLPTTQKRTHMQADKAYREQRDLVREQIEELTKFEEQSSCQSVQDVQVKKGDHKQRLQKRVENEFSNRLYSQLMKAQASIVVTSATAKLLVIKKEDKGLLNEYLRVCLDRVILETNFADLDRPERNHVDVQTAVQMSRGWTTFKEKFMHQIMRESKMEKKTNKLLDD